MGGTPVVKNDQNLTAEDQELLANMELIEQMEVLQNLDELQNMDESEENQ